MSEDVSLAIHGCALGISPVTSYSGVKNNGMAAHLHEASLRVAGPLPRDGPQLLQRGVQRAVDDVAPRGQQRKRGQLRSILREVAEHRQAPADGR